MRAAECVGIEPRDACVEAFVRRDDGSERRVEAEWVVAADGAGSSVRRMLGIPMEGIGPLARFVMVHFEADLVPWIQHRSGPIFFIMNPESPGCLIVHDPKRSHVFMLPELGARGSRAERSRSDSLPRSACRVTPTLLSVDTWSPHVQVAARYRAGARLPGRRRGAPLPADRWARPQHRDPGGVRPGAATGGGCGRGRPEALLEGYEAACRPAARANAERSVERLPVALETDAVPSYLAPMSAPARVRASAGLEVRVSNVSRTFRTPGEPDVPAVDRIDLAALPGAFVAILGPSGCGKSTLLRMIAGLDRPDAGAIELRDAAGGAAPRGAIAYVFQDAHLLPWRDVLDNVALPLELQGRAAGERRDAARARSSA